MRLARQIAAQGLSVRQAERLASRQASRSRTTRLRKPSPDLLKLEESLSAALAARVEIKHKRRGGKIVVHFADNHEFERLYEQIAGQATSQYPAKVPA